MKELQQYNKNQPITIKTVMRRNTPSGTAQFINMPKTE